jgi:hypothetical protein
MGWSNLDFQCQEFARVLAGKIASDKQAKKLINDCASVIARQGPCASVLYLKDKARKSATATGILSSLQDVFELVDGPRDEAEKSTTPADAAEKRSKAIANDLAKLLLLRKLMLQLFAYLRHYVGTEA